MSSSNNLKNLFDNKDKIDISNIIDNLLNKYNKPYDDVEPIFKENQHILDFNSIIMELKNVEKKCIKQDGNKYNSLFNPSITVKNILELNFVDDLNLLESIIEYRKLVIRHIILICNYNIEAYKCLMLNVIYLLHLQQKIEKSDFVNKNNIDNDIKRLQFLKDKCKSHIISLTSKSVKYYQETICRYIEINDKLQIVKSNVKSSTISISI
jgi:hypothetical protein